MIDMFIWAFTLIFVVAVSAIASLLAVMLVMGIVISVAKWFEARNF